MRSRYEPDNMPLYIEEWEQILTLHWKHIAALLIAVTEEAILLADLTTLLEAGDFLV